MAGGSVRSLAAAVIAAMIAAGAAASASAKCVLARYFELPVTVDGAAAFMDVKVDGVPTRFQIDTGAFFSVITPDGAKRLGLKPDVGGPQFSVNGVGGSEDAYTATAKTFDFSGAPLKNVQFVVAGRRFADGVTGLIGENVLGTFAEVEYDFAKGKIGFFKVQGCRGVDVGYWANKDGSDDLIPIEPVGRFPNIIGTVTVNGHKMRALFDTGAHDTLMTKWAAARAGIRPDSPGVRPSQGVRGVGHRAGKSWIAPVASFKIGNEEIKNTQIEFGEMELNDADMLLGIDFFLSHHIFVVHSQNRLYFTYNGGPVFKLDAADAVAPTAAVGSAKDPDTLDHEGDDFMARHQFEAALAAYARAAELDPKTASRWMKRAKAELALKRVAAALSDLDRAIGLKPDDADARMLRGEVRLASGEFAEAQADFEAAAKAAPPGDDMQFRIAAIYERRGHWAEAIPHLDAWLDAHSRESAAPAALEMRCQARAMLGTDLAKALADCDAAIRSNRAPAFLMTRGLLRLRMGQPRPAIEDYDAALRSAPKLGWALYGRGLAKVRLGQAAPGEADLEAAVALDGGLTEWAEPLDLVSRVDLDRAIQLKPDAVEIRMLRGWMELKSGALEAARADFDAAAKAMPTASDMQLRIAMDYARQELWAEEIPHLDAWLDLRAASAPAVSAAVALNNRCWARAMLGRDLDKALADCDAAIQRDPTPTFRDSRGMVRLRLGHPKAAITDYDVALQAQPRKAWSLYGRGLAEKRLGQTAAGEADIRAALAIDPGLGEKARKIGLVDPPAAAAPRPAG